MAFNPLWAAGGGAAAAFGPDFLDDLFPNPADEAGKPLGKIAGTIKPYYQPYINAGENSLNNSKARFGNLSSSGAQSSLEDIFSQLSSDPNAFIQKLAS
jgi:hypothetical protein